MRVLCSGDLHLGRRPTRLPSRLDAHALSCAAAWDAIVEHAVSQRVDAVALSGDLVDQDNRFYEAIGPLERGLRRLAAAGIPAVAVAGNHDHGVLPSLARTLPHGCLRLLGVGGRWERATLALGGGTLHVDGWSFPASHVRESPLASYDLPAPPDGVVLGLLHGDLEAPASTYAPLALADLRARAVHAWLLGHVHAARVDERAGAAPVMYPGSPQPLDPGEEGAHGALLLDLAPGRPVVVTRVPIATVCYASLDVDVSDAPDLATARALIHDRVSRDAAARARGTPLRHLSLRLRLTGRSALHRELAREASLMRAGFETEVGETSVHVDRVDVAVRPALDLDALSLGGDAIAVVARMLRDLERGACDGDVDAMLAAADRIPATLQGARPYRSLVTPVDDDRAALREALARQAGRLLDEMLAQKEAAA